MAGSIFVTGGGGFIGRHLVAQLQRQGRCVAPIARHDLAEETDWRALLRGVEVVVHLAALAHERAAAAERRRDYEPLFRVNALGTERLASAAAMAGVRHFIFLSTIGVHGEQTDEAPFMEHSPPAPCTLYATSKLWAEQLLAKLASQSALAVTALRPTLVYGPGNGGNMLRLLRWIERGWPLPFGSVRNKRTLTCVHNLVSAITSVLDRAGPYEAFVVCDAESLSTSQIVRSLADGMQRPARFLSVPQPVLHALGRVLGKAVPIRRLEESLEADCTKLTRLTGWRPTIVPSEGLRATGEWFRRRSHRA